MINWQQWIFFLFAFVAIASAVMVVTSRNPVRSVLFLVVTFFASAGIWLMAQAEFLSLILVVVYVGAVMTLFLFVVMMLNIDVAERKYHLIKYFPIGLSVVALLVAALIYSGIKPENFVRPIVGNSVDAVSNVRALGQVLYTDYVYPFEVAAVLLMVAIIAAISLAYRGVRQSKVQQVSEQLAVRREDRVRLVKMPAEKKEGKS